MPQLKAFLVEDSSIIRENLIDLLEEALPMSVVGIAEDEFTALKWFDSSDNDCDIVIVDIFLKAGSGLGLLKAAAGIYKPAKWVVFSNHATADMRERCMELGADCVFDKSNEIEGLLLYCKQLAGVDTTMQ